MGLIILSFCEQALQLHRFMSYGEFIEYIGAEKTIVSGKQNRSMTKQRSQHFILYYYAEGMSSYL